MIYNEYGNNIIEYIGHYTQLPDGWCYATIKEVFIINPKNKADDDVEVGFVPMANITDGYNNTFKYETKQFMYTAPIPSRDIDLIPGMIQNEGYVK